MNLQILQDKLRKAAFEALSNGVADVVIGYGEGSLKNKTSPLFVRKPEDASKLVFNQHCSSNLAVYLKKVKPGEKKIGLVVKGCDSRTLASLIHEKQIARDKLYIIGVDCYGLVDKDSPDEENPSLDSNCAACQTKTPVVYDILIAFDEKDIKKIEKETPTGFSDKEIAEFEKLSPKERWEFFKKETERCVRCYACRNACPLCYCENCFVDSSDPKWIQEGLNVTDLTFYHIVRILHAAGRCGECGACERACPMNIRLKFLTRKMNYIIGELFGEKSGMSADEAPALGTFKENDENTIFK